MNYYPHHIGDYAKDTGHLSWDEDMAYTRLLRAYYGREGAIPADQAYRLARAATRPQKEAVDTVLKEFFVLQEDGWHNKRADAELEIAQSKSEKARISAGKRWHNTPSNANAMRTHSEGNAPNNQEPITKQKAPAASGEFDRFWQAYPKRVAKPIALKAWAKNVKDAEQVLKALDVAKVSPEWQRDEGKFIPHPATWLNQRRFEDEAPAPQLRRVAI